MGGLVSRIPGLGGRSKPPNPKDPTDEVVQRMLDHQLIRVPGLTAGLERRLYASVVALLIDTIADHLRDFDVTAFRHRVHIDVQVLDRFTDPVFVDTDPDFFVRLVDVYMKQSPSIRLRGLPHRFQKRVYANILGIVIGVVDVVLQSLSLSLLGHAFTTHIRSLTPEELAESLSRANTAEPCSKKTSRVLQTIVDAHIRKHPFRWIPNRLHRSALFHAIRVVRALLAEIVESASVDVLGYRLRAWFVTANNVEKQKQGELHAKVIGN